MTDKNAIHQLLGHPPSWMLRWGILLISLVFFLIGLLSWFIQYPDRITAKVVFHTEVLPLRVEMPVDGQIDSVFLKNKMNVNQGQVLIAMKSTATYTDLLIVDDFCKKWTPQSTSPIMKNLSLGTINSLWSAFVLHKKELDFFYQNDITAAKIKNLQQQTTKLNELHDALLDEKNTFQEKINLAQKAKKRDEKLMQSNAASTIELEQSIKKLLDAKQAFEQHVTTIIHNQIQIERLRADLLDIDYQQKKQKSTKILQLQGDITAIQTAISLWKEQHLILAPITGIVNWNDTWVTEQFLTKKIILGAISPTLGQGKIIATAFVPNQRFGKIQEGAKVQIQLAAYPYQEFGVLKGHIYHIPAIAEAGFYKVKIQFNQPLETTYRKKIPFRQELEGIAHITTQKRRLAERFFDRILSVSCN